jgi:hypothetical protein
MHGLAAHARRGAADCGQYRPAFVVCGFAAFIAYVGWKESDNLFLRLWAGVFGLIAVLFNPLVPIYFKRTTWFGIDIGIAIIFVVHLVIVTGPSNRR